MSSLPFALLGAQRLLRAVQALPGDNQDEQDLGQLASTSSEYPSHVVQARLRNLQPLPLSASQWAIFSGDEVREFAAVATAACRQIAAAHMGTTRYSDSLRVLACAASRIHASSTGRYEVVRIHGEISGELELGHCEQVFWGFAIDWFIPFLQRSTCSWRPLLPFGPGTAVLRRPCKGFAESENKSWA